MTYKDNSDWNDINEIRCLIILKILILENFPRNRQMELSKELARTSKLSKESISAKVSNFKSLAKINNNSNASKNSKLVFEKYNGYTIVELQKKVDDLEAEKAKNENDATLMSAQLEKVEKSFWNLMY